MLNEESTPVPTLPKDQRRLGRHTERFAAMQERFRSEI
jgi:hypothetical protein